MARKPTLTPEERAARQRQQEKTAKAKRHSQGVSNLPLPLDQTMRERLEAFLNSPKNKAKHVHKSTLIKSVLNEFLKTQGF